MRPLTRATAAKPSAVPFQAYSWWSMSTRGRVVWTVTGTVWNSAGSTGVTRISASLSNRSRITSESHVEMTILRSGSRYVASTAAASPWYRLS